MRNSHLWHILVHYFYPIWKNIGFHLRKDYFL